MNDNSTDLSQQLSDLENKIKEMNSKLDIVQGQYSDCKREIIMLERDKKDKELRKTDLQKIMTTSKHNIEAVRIEYEGVKRKFFSQIREGR